MDGMYLLLDMVGMLLLPAMELGRRDMIIGDRREDDSISSEHHHASLYKITI